MPTVGNTAQPLSTVEAWGAGSKNHHAVLITMPSGGPWLITRLGGWLRGYITAADYRLCLWSAAGTLLRSGPLGNVSGAALAASNCVKAESDITPYEASGGQQFYVGFARDPGDALQFGRYSSGSHLDRYDAAWPAGLGGSTTDSDGALSAYIADYESANAAPNAPTGLSPTGDAVVHSGTAPSVSGTRSDPDSGDYITAYEIECWNDALSTRVYHSGQIGVGGTPTTFARTISLPSSHAFYRWRARTRDKGSLWGPWSGYQRFKANSVPQTPDAPLVDSDTLTPRIDGSFFDSGDTLAAVDIEVLRWDGSVWQPHWQGEVAKSGASGSAWNHTYSGPALAWGTDYMARYRTKDSHGAYSIPGAWRDFTPVQPVGPDNLTPRTTNPRLASLTPTLTVGHSATFRNEEIEVYAANSLGSTRLWYKTWDGADYAAVTSKARVYAGAALARGGVYYWRARVELSADGTISAWSPLFPIRLNATPGSPTGLSPTGGVVLTDTTPQLRMRFADADTDQGDTASLVTLEVRNNATDALVYSQTGVAPVPGTGEDGQAYDHLVSTPALGTEVTYKWRARFTDAMGLQGAFGAYQVFKVSVAPTVALVAPAAASVVTESTPVLDWSYSSPGGKAQKSYRVRVFDKGPTGDLFPSEVEVHDSGTRLSADTHYDLPFGVLDDDHDYRWSVLVADTDGLTKELA